VTLRVNDTGAGIDPRVRHRLFEPLVTTKVRGIGLGLALCRRLAERNGGSLTLVVGELPGAAFDLTLPRAAPETP
jgi:signal transduction histidine kinase